MTPAAVVEFRGTGKTYPARRGLEQPPAIENFDFQLADGEFVCLLGPSGCGKTTVLNMLAGFEAATSGDVLIRGEPVRGPGVDRGVVFQRDECLLPWASVMANVMFGPRLAGMPKGESHKRAQHFIDMVGLSGQEGKRPPELSGGMRQRVQLARVLANRPVMLCMDEPFAALDAQTRARLQDELTRIWITDKPTVLFITHDVMEAILLADRVAVMTSGPRSTIKAVVPIDLDRPRRRSDSRVGQLYEEIGQLIEPHQAASTVG